jgi:hypothetical protein
MKDARRGSKALGKDLGARDIVEEGPGGTVGAEENGEENGPVCGMLCGAIDPEVARGSSGGVKGYTGGAKGSYRGIGILPKGAPGYPEYGLV